MSNASDFIIENGVLTKYNGPGGDVVIPEGVTEIGERAFSLCNTIKDVVVSDSVTRISDHAFAECKSLESIVIPNSVTSIGEEAFTFCTSLKNVDLPESVADIGEKAFYKCPALANAEGFVVFHGILFYYAGPDGDVIIPREVTEIGKDAFWYSNISKVTIPDSVKKIGMRAFCSCELRNVSISGSVTSMGTKAFCSCKNLENVLISEGITCISDEMFQYCEELKRVVLPSSITNIGREAFCGCRNLANITIPDGVTDIGYGAFDSCGSLTDVIIPSGVKRIKSRTFGYCRSLKSVKITEGVTSIDMWAFSGYDNLISVRIPNSVTSIEEWAFNPVPIFFIEDISRMPSCHRPQAAVGFAISGGGKGTPGFESHSKYIKANAAKLVDTAMEELALLAMMCREKLITPKNVELYVEAAQKTGNAEAIALMLDYQANKISDKQKESVEKHREKEQATVDDRLKARQGKKGIKGLNIAVTGKLESFEKRDELKEFITRNGGYLASSLTSKVDYLIMNDPGSDSAKAHKAQKLGIEIITERQFNELAGRAFIMNKQALIKYVGVGGKVTIPNGVTSIGNYAFTGQKCLTSLLIPEGVTSIGEKAFCNCSNLIEIIIPESVRSIDSDAFEGTPIFEDGTHWEDNVLYLGHCLLKAKNSIRGAYAVKEGTQCIGSFAFVGCKKLKSVTIPDSVMSICDGVFFNSKCVFDGCLDLTIHAPTGSYAEQYAKENNIPFVAEEG